MEEATEARRGTGDAELDGIDQLGLTGEGRRCWAWPLSGANPKNLALTLAASAAIANAELGGADTAIAIATFVAIGSISVVGAVAFYLAAPAKAARPLATVKEFMANNNAVIMMVILLLLGAEDPRRRPRGRVGLTDHRGGAGSDRTCDRRIMKSARGGWLTPRRAESCRRRTTRFS